MANLDTAATFQRLLSRKFLVTVAVLTLASIFLGFGKIDQGTWMTTVLAVLTIYVGSNVGAVVANKMKDAGESTEVTRSWQP